MCTSECPDISQRTKFFVRALFYHVLVGMVTQENCFPGSNSQIDEKNPEVLVLRDRLARIQRQYETLLMQHHQQMMSAGDESQVNKKLRQLQSENEQLKLNSAANAQLHAELMQMSHKYEQLRVRSVAPIRRIWTLDQHKQIVADFYQSFPTVKSSELETALLENSDIEVVVGHVRAICINGNPVEWDAFGRIALAVIVAFPAAQLAEAVVLNKSVPKHILFKLLSVCVISSDLLFTITPALCAELRPVSLLVNEALLLVKQISASLQLCPEIILAVARLLLVPPRNLSRVAANVLALALSYSKDANAFLSQRSNALEPTVGQKSFLMLFEEAFMWTRHPESANSDARECCLRDSMQIVVRMAALGGSLGEYTILVAPIVTLLTQLRPTSPIVEGFFYGDLEFLKALAGTNPVFQSSTNN